MSWTDVTWDSSTAVNVSISGATITGTNATTAAFTSNAKTTHNITDKIKITNVYSSGAYTWMIGLGKDPFSDSSQTYNAIEYCWHYNGTSGFQIYENGVSKGFHYANSTAIPEIRRNGSTVEYYLDDVLKYTSSFTESGSLYAQFSCIKLASASVQYWSSTTGSGTGSGTAPMYSSSGSTPHNEAQALHIFKHQRDWF